MQKPFFLKYRIAFLAAVKLGIPCSSPPPCSWADAVIQACSCKLLCARAMIWNLVSGLLSSLTVVSASMYQWSGLLGFHPVIVIALIVAAAGPLAFRGFLVNNKWDLQGQNIARK